MIIRLTEKDSYDSPYKKGSAGDLAKIIVKALGEEEPYDDGTDETLTELEEFFGIDFGFAQEDRFADWDEIEDEVFNQLADQPVKLLRKYMDYLDEYGYSVF